MPQAGAVNQLVVIIKAPMPKISVNVCTYNRCESLKDLLECLLIQDISKNNCWYEIIVIDNNSNDKTKNIVEEYIPKFNGRLRYFFEPRQGKPFALNLGIMESKGEILAYIDDDCLVGKDYLNQVDKVFQEYGAEIDFVGGRIEPHWVNCSKPAWFADLKPGWWYKEFFWGPLAVLDYGDEPFIIDKSRILSPDLKLFYGANMAIRKELFLRHGAFDLEKRNAHDTEFQLRFLREGTKGLYAPEVKVKHKITAGRLTPEYYYRWYFLRGIYLEIEEKYQKKFYHPFGIHWSMIVKTVALLVASVFAGSLTQKVYLRCHALFNLGQMKQIMNKRLSVGEK